MSLPLTIDPNHIITNIRRRKIDISACQKHFGYSVLLFLSGLLNVKQILPSIRVQHLSAFSPLISRFESSSKFLPHQPHVMIWKWESKPLPVVWENPIAGDNIFQNPVFPSWRKTFFTTQVVILPVAEIHQEKVLPFKLFRVWTNIFYFHLNLNSPFENLISRHPHIFSASFIIRTDKFVKTRKLKFWCIENQPILSPIPHCSEKHFQVSDKSSPPRVLTAILLHFIEPESILFLTEAIFSGNCFADQSTIFKLCCDLDSMFQYFLPSFARYGEVCAFFPVY